MQSTKEVSVQYESHWSKGVDDEVLALFAKILSFVNKET